MTKKLTPKQEGFVQSLLIPGTSQRQAYKDNYNCKSATDKTLDESACKLLAKPKVNARYRELVDKLNTRMEEKALVTAENVLQSILDIRKTCTTEIGMYTKLGTKVGETMVDINGGLKANELLGKHLKLFTDKHEVDISGTLGVTIIDDIK